MAMSEAAFQYVLDRATGAARSRSSASVERIRAASLRSRSLARRDLLIVLAALVLAVVMADSLDINERFINWAKGYEARTGIELEELPVAVSLAAWALAWYAWRRWRQYRREAADHLATDAHLQVTADALAVANSRLSDAIEAIPEGFVLFDAEDRFVLWNGRYAEIYRDWADLLVVGRRFEEMLRMGVARGQYPGAKGREEEWIARRLVQHAERGGSFEQQLTNGRWVRVEERRIADGGSVGIRIDITEQKRREAELREAREYADAGSRAKSEFLANMSHELRTPLNAVLGFSEIIAGELMGPAGNRAYRDYAADIHKSGAHLLRIINDVLDLARVEAGKLTLRPEPFESAELLRQVHRMLVGRANTAGVDLQVDVDGRVPLMLADPDRVRQVLLNLISNAIKFTPSGGVVVASQRFDAVRSHLVLEVRDTGIGIAAQDIETVLSAFGQVESAISRRHNGVGLGLPLSKCLVEVMGGSFSLTSTPGIGTRVVLELPSAMLDAIGQRGHEAQAAAI
jgi:signal transduction histidine kinase